MRSGTWDGASTDDNVRVTVNGTVRPVKDVSVQSGMRDGHPAAETSSWCIEATIEWADPKSVTADSPHPFGEGTDWMPRDGDEVVIETGDGALDQWWVQHRGVIDSTSGSIADGTAVSRTVDDVEELDKPVEYVALPARMTPVRDGEPFRYQDMQGVWYVDRMLRDESSGARGWHATPPITWQTLAACTGLGSVRPEVGTLQAANARGDSTSGPTWVTADDGRPYPTDYITTTTFKDSATTRRFVLTFDLPNVDPTVMGGGIYVRDVNSAGPSVTESNGSLFFRHNANNPSMEAPILGATRAALLYERVTSTNQTMTLRFDDGREFVHNTTTGDLPANWQADRVYVSSDHLIGWWMLEDDKPAGQEWASLESTPTARFRVNEFNYWNASRDQPRVAASESIEEQLEAECAAAWLDEDGHFQWAGRTVLDTQPVAQTVTSALDLDELQWGTQRRSGARSVVIRYLSPRIDVDGGGWASRTFWTSDSIDVDPGEEEVVTVSIPSEEDWVAVDVSPHHIYEWGRPWDHYRRGSTFGGTQYRKSDSDQAAWCQFITCTMTSVGLRDFEVSFTPWSSISSTDRVNSTWPPNATSATYGRSPTALRGRMRLVWREREVSAATGNPTAGPRYVHEVGWRVQGGNGVLSSLLAWLAAELGDPQPTVTLSLVHDPRRQIGDKIRVEDEHVTGTWVEMLVQERDTDVDGFTDTIRGRVTAHGNLTDVTLHAPAGHTALTPATDWNREVA